jgi:hypothetical protein
MGPWRASGDLNLLKIASNYLKDVPLRTGGSGDIGDLQEAVVVGDGLNTKWSPLAQPAYSPQDRMHRMSITVSGRLNAVDAIAQGHAPIAPAYKPSLQATLTANEQAFRWSFPPFTTPARHASSGKTTSASRPWCRARRRLSGTLST